MRRVAIGDIVLKDIEDHLAAAKKRWHGVEMLAPCPEYADARRPIGLVAGENIEIAAQILDVDRHVDGGLAAIDQYRNAALMSDAADLPDRHDGAGDVRHMRDRHDFGAIGERLFKRLQIEGAVFLDADPFDDRAAPLAMVMPGHDIGMVLHDGQHDLIALADHHAAEGLGDEVEALGR
jgi:hypothetical protein